MKIKLLQILLIQNYGNYYHYMVQKIIICYKLHIMILLKYYIYI